MAENSIDWKKDKKLKSFLKLCAKKTLRQEEMLDFVATDSPQYRNWSMAVFNRSLRQFKIKYIKKETSIEEVKDAVKRNWMEQVKPSGTEWWTRNFEWNMTLKYLKT